MKLRALRPQEVTGEDINYQGGNFSEVMASHPITGTS